MNYRRVCVGIIAKPVGIKGQVKIHPYTNSPQSFLDYSNFSLANGSVINLENPEINKDGDIITKIEGYADRTAVESLRLNEIYIRREDLKPIFEDEYYFEDLTGLDVFNNKLEKIGKVNAALDYGAGTFLDIQLEAKNKVGTLPFNKETILDVDLKKNLIKVDDSYILV